MSEAAGQPPPAQDVFVLESVPDAEARDFSVCRFPGGLPNFSQFALPVRSFHYEIEEEDDDEDDDAGEQAAGIADEAALLNQKKPHKKSTQDLRMDRLMRSDVTGEGWALEDDAGQTTYEGTVQKAQKAQYVVFACQPKSKKVVVMPVKQWHTFKRTSHKMQQNRSVAAAAFAGSAKDQYAGRKERSGTNKREKGAAPRKLPTGIERLGKDKSPPAAGAGGAAGGDSEGGLSDADDGMDFIHDASDDNAEDRVGGLGKAESASEGEAAGGAAHKGVDGKAPRKFVKYGDELDDGVGVGGDDSDDYNYLQGSGSGSGSNDDPSDGGGMFGKDEDEGDLSDGEKKKDSQAAAASEPQKDAAEPVKDVKKERKEPPSRPGLTLSAPKIGQQQQQQQQQQGRPEKRPRGPEGEPAATAASSESSARPAKRPREGGPGLILTEESIVAFISSHQVSMKDFLKKLKEKEKGALQTKEGKQKLKSLLKSLKVKTKPFLTIPVK
jgi:hypothetical protein